MHKSISQVTVGIRSWHAWGLIPLLCFQINPARAQLDDSLGRTPGDHVQAAALPSRPMQFALAPPKKGQEVAGTHLKDPQAMKLLLIGVDGTEPGYAAMQAFLDQIGIPYDSFLSFCRLNATPCAMPVFNKDATHANYYGIVMTVGNLSYCPTATTCKSAFSTADWAALDAFTAAFGVRTLVYYDFGEPRYGLTYSNIAITPTATAPLNLTVASGQTAATGIFPYLKSTAQIPVENAYVYFATTVAATGETTTPILSATYGGKTYTVGALHTAATKQQYLTLTVDNSPYLLHSMVLNYGLLNWVTKGLFLGSKKIYLSPQVDDVFIADDLYDGAIANCVPSGFLIDPTVDLSLGCPVTRMNGNDLTALYQWQSALNAVPQTANFRVTLGFNGLGATPAASGGDQPANDTLVPAVKTLAKYFYWVSHTYDHENLDCYDAVPNSGVCPEATAAQANTEIMQNVAVANQLGLGWAGDVGAGSTMITPEISGLANPNFISTAYKDGLRYLVSDASKAGQGVTTTNVGIPNAIDPRILEIPRFATNIFYNADIPTVGAAGSEVDEYNHFYGPLGITKLPNGQPFYTTNQTYAQILDTESNNLLYNMWRGYAFPSMFHQSNLRAYSKGASLFTDTIGTTIIKFEQLSNLPIISQNEYSIGTLLRARMAYNASDVVAEWTPAGPTGTGLSTGSITLTVLHPATITMTGVICTPAANVTCESYGGQTIAHITMTSTTPTFTLSSPL